MKRYMVYLLNRKSGIGIGITEVEANGARDAIHRFSGASLILSSRQYVEGDFGEAQVYWAIYMGDEYADGEKVSPKSVPMFAVPID